MRPRNPLQVRDPDALRKRAEASTRVAPHSTRSLAEVTGFSRATISGLMTGRKQRVTRELAESFAEAVGASVDELFTSILSASADTDNGSAGAQDAPAHPMCAGMGASAPEEAR